MASLAALAPPISDFCHVNRVVSMLSKLPPVVCLRGGGGGGGGGNRLAKKGREEQQASLWNFHRYRLVCNIVQQLKLGLLVY